MTPDTRALLAAYAARIDDELLTAGKAPTWDQGVMAATAAVAVALEAGVEPAMEAIEHHLANATPTTDSPGVRAGFVAAEGRLIGFLHGGEAASRALFNLIPLEK